MLATVTANLQSTKHDWKPTDFFPARNERRPTLAEKAKGLFRSIARR